MTLTLAKFQTKQIAELFSWFQSEEDVLLWAGANMSWPLERKDMVSLIREHKGQAPRREVWAVFQNNEMVGHFQIRLNRRLRTAGLGRIALAPKKRGQGLSNEVVHMALVKAFSHAWVHRAELMVYDHNHPAIAAYRANGFSLEGTRRETTPIQNKLWNTNMMSILRYEFDKRT